MAQRHVRTVPLPFAPLVLSVWSRLPTGVQHLNGTTVSGVALRIKGATVPDGRHPAITADLTPTEARELAHALATLADQAETLDGLHS